MTDEQKTEPKDTSAAAPKHPYMLGYVVRPYDDGNKASWSRIAVAWAHKDDQGYDVRMDALPVDGRLVLRTVRDEDPKDAEVVEPTPDGLS